MLKYLEKSWSLISLFLTLALLVSLSFLPGIARPLSLTVMCLSLAVILTLTIRQHTRVQRAGKVSRQRMVGGIVIDVSDILVSMAAALLAAWTAGAYAARAAGEAWGITAGILSALGVGLVVGFCVSLSVRWLWQKLTRPFLAKAAWPA